MNDRDIDTVVLNHFGIPEDIGAHAWKREFNRIALDNAILRAAASKYSDLSDGDMSAPAVLARHLFFVAKKIAEHLHREVENRHKAIFDASQVEKETANAEAILLGIQALERQAAMAS